MSYIYGVLNLSWVGYIFATLILTQITIAAVTIYLHRHQTHRALELHPIVSHFFRFWLWITTAMVTKEWVAIHRKHHAKCETPDDPHSPKVLGIKKVLWEGVELYREEAKNQDTLEQYGSGTPDDWVERNVYSRFPSIGILLMAIIDGILFGIPAITIWAIQMMWIPFFAAGVVNGIGHYWGYRNYECAEAARNIVPWGIFIGGEELHNNHHTFASSAKLSSKKWEIDMGWVYIRILAFFKLATVKRLPPEFTLKKEKSTIDGETLKVVLANRFQVMARYSKEVMVPVFKQEKAKAGEASRALFRRVKKALIRETSLVSQSQKQRLTKLLESKEHLAVVYQYRMKLQEIWSKTAANQKELLEALKEWCKQAEATGIEALREFADSLKMYVPVPARI